MSVAVSRSYRDSVPAVVIEVTVLAIIVVATAAVDTVVVEVSAAAVLVVV
jgi:hypothetical protein